MAEHGIVVVDTGPLVAMLRQDDLHHAICCRTMDLLKPPLITTWPVITEAAWLLRDIHEGVSNLLRLLESRLIFCEELDANSPAWLRKFLADYDDLSPQLADASLVRIVENNSSTTIFTLDRRDFVVFRNKLGEPFRLLPEVL